MYTLRLVAILLAIALFSGCSNLQVKNATPLGQIPNVKDTEQNYYIQVGDVVQLRLESNRSSGSVQERSILQCKQCNKEKRL